MKESDKNIEDLIEKMMSENTLESPSIDFVSTVMSQVLLAEERKIKIYKPLISKQIWMIIAASLIVLTVWATISGNEHSFAISESYTDVFSNLFSGFHFSEKVLYAILIVPFMILIQITLLKNYFDKKHQF